jgi:hypothetical protein
VAVDETAPPRQDKREVAAKFGWTGSAHLQWVAREIVPMVRNRSGFGSGLIRFWFDFVPLENVGMEAVVKAVRFRFDFGSVSVRF